MASYLQIENISKSYGPKVLFEKIGSTSMKATRSLSLLPTAPARPR